MNRKFWVVWDSHTQRARYFKNADEKKARAAFARIRYGHIRQVRETWLRDYARILRKQIAVLREAVR